MLHFIAVFICKDNQRILSPRDKDFLNDTGAISDGLKTTDCFVQAIAMSLGPSNTSVLQCYENKDKHMCPVMLEKQRHTQLFCKVVETKPNTSAHLYCLIL